MSGLLNKEQEKFWSDLILEKIKLTGWKGVLLRFGVPIAIKQLDDNFGEKIPEPWKSWATQLTTTVYLALQDGVVTQDEVDAVADLAATVINEYVDIPNMAEEAELLVFQATLKSLAAVALALLLGKKEAADKEPE